MLSSRAAVVDKDVSTWFGSETSTFSTSAFLLSSSTWRGDSGGSGVRVFAISIRSRCTSCSPLAAEAILSSTRSIVASTCVSDSGSGVRTSLRCEDGVNDDMSLGAGVPSVPSVVGSVVVGEVEDLASAFFRLFFSFFILFFIVFSRRASSFRESSPGDCVSEGSTSVVIWLAGVGVREESVSVPLASGSVLGDVRLSVARNIAIAWSDSGGELEYPVSVVLWLSDS